MPDPLAPENDPTTVVINRGPSALKIAIIVVLLLIFLPMVIYGILGAIAYAKFESKFKGACRYTDANGGYTCFAASSPADCAQGAAGKAGATWSTKPC